jgi:hypothetical protein
MTPRGCCYTHLVDDADVRAWAARDWPAAERAKQEYWARAYAEHGPVVTVTAAQELWQHMRSVRPDWPSDDERAADLAHHVALKQTLDAAARVLGILTAR